MKAIAAMSLNRVIGDKGKIPWHLPEDLKWFKQFTLNQTIVVGRKTFEDLPPLANRKILILSRNAEFFERKDVLKNTTYKVIREADEIPKGAIIAGGAQIYQELLPYCSELFLTQVKAHMKGDTAMPPFEHFFRNQETLLDERLFSITRFYN